VNAPDTTEPNSSPNPTSLIAALVHPIVLEAVSNGKQQESRHKGTVVHRGLSGIGVVERGEM